MVEMKQRSPSASSSQTSRAMPLPSLSHGVPTPAHALTPSPSAKRLRLTHGGSFNYASVPSSSSASSSSPPSSSSSLSPFDASSIPASLAPSSIHRQHSSGTGQVLESSLFDQSGASPLMGAWHPYPLQSPDLLSFSPHPSAVSDEDFANGPGMQVGVRKSLSSASFNAHTQPGFDSLSPSVSSPPHSLALSSPLHHYTGADFSFSHPSNGHLGAYGDLPQYSRDQSFLLTGAQEGSDSAYDFSSPTNAGQQPLPIGTLHRLTSDDVFNAGPQPGEPSSQLKASPPSSVAPQSGAAVPLVPNFPHIVPPSLKASGSLSTSPASTPPSTPKSPSHQVRSSKKRQQRASDEDGEKDERASVSSAASSHSQSSSSKDRHVNTAVKLVTSNDESGDVLMDTKVKQIFYNRPDWPKPHRIRLIEVEDLKTHRRSVYAHGADVGSVVERKSNISRLFGKFTSPNEKLLMNVPGPHNHTVGQESNILTEMGIRRFLDTNKMKGQDHYKAWILQQLIPRLRNGEVVEDAGRQTPVKREGGASHLQPQLHPPGHHLGVYSTDSPQSLPSSPQSYSSYSSESYHSSH